MTFKCAEASPLDLIRAVGRQSRLPIGIALGRDPEALSRPTRSYDLQKVDAKTALLKATHNTAYMPKEENDVMVLVAGDLTSRQKELLTHRFSGFASGHDQTAVGLEVSLTMWLRAVSDPKAGFAGSILSSTNEERLTLEAGPSGTAEEIANKIVSLGSRGMWFFERVPLLRLPPRTR